MKIRATPPIRDFEKLTMNEKFEKSEAYSLKYHFVTSLNVTFYVCLELFQVQKPKEMGSRR